MNLTFQQIAVALGVTIDIAGLATGWSIDSRTIERGDFFFPLHGPNHDGHAHLAAAFEKGAVAAVVDRAVETAGFTIRVPDTLAALQSIAAWARTDWAGDVVGVTGSAGKTTTKEIMAGLLSSEMPVGKTIGNFNNHVGLPLSILRLPRDARVAVLELGMNHAGEIRELAKIARPQIAVVTNVGPAHIENFDSLEGVAAAKRELVEALPSDGVAVLNADDPLVASFGAAHSGKTITYGIVSNANVQARDVESLDTGVRFSVEDVVFTSHAAGRHNILNILAGIAVGREYGIGLARLAEAAAALPASLKMRGERITHNGVTIWNDCYNANPDAMRAMIDVLKETPAQRRFAVLGEMRELGTWSEKLHSEAGHYVAESGIDFLIAIHGDAHYMVDAAAMPQGAAHFVDDPETAGELLKEMARPGDAVLFKGSRGTHVERALERYLA
jgi:UDP-N-acetylmuramoyl-tripeptide--D-alanyl-D-alanine ligase